MRKYFYLCCFILLLGCSRGEDPAPVTDGDILDTPKLIESFWIDYASSRPWKISRLSFVDSTVVSSLSEDPFNIDTTKIVDLYAELSPCRKDDVYNFSYEGGNVPINFTDRYESEQQRCNTQEPSFIERGLYLAFNGSLTMAQASFRNNDAVRQFFDFKRLGAGTEYRGYEMEWTFKVLSDDSINIEGNFLRSPLPDLKIQFIPDK